MMGADTHSTVVAIVQARMGSARFPGKMLADLGGVPVLEWVLRRVARAHRIDRVVLATSTLGRDDPLVELAERLGMGVFRGDESDVLSRFIAAARRFDAGWVVRVCADNPFIDPVELDRLVEFFMARECHYAFNNLDRFGSGYADGFGAEMMAVETLEKIARVTSEARHREHVTTYLVENPTAWVIRAVPAPPELAHPDLRFDVDTPEDLAYLATLVEAGVRLDDRAERIVSLAIATQASHPAALSSPRKPLSSDRLLDPDRA